MQQSDSVLILACGALAHEIRTIIKANQWGRQFDLKCLSAELHNKPELIAPKLAEKIGYWKSRYRDIFVAYGDCGSNGEIDRLLQSEKIERIPGAHCYEFFAGNEVFSKLSEEEPGTFFLTDFLTKNFERLVVRGLKLDQYPELIEMFFGNYKRVVYLVQSSDPVLTGLARGIADYLGLEFEERHSGYGDLERGLGQKIFATS